jgi:2-succinyl-5-enolpyruvyl-6-hydroxy-3-cyclohexene-1-carboxylate synthase
LNYTIASDESSLDKALFEFYACNDQPQLLEIFTPTRKNDSILLNYFKNLV